MKLFIGILLVFLSLADGKVLLSRAEVVSTNIIRDLPPAVNVTVNATWTFTSVINVTTVVMTIHNLQASQYAAMGLSQNDSMGEAHVFICKRFADNAIAIQRFVNPGEHQHPQPAGSEQGGVFTPLPSKFADGVVTCQFNLSNFATQTGQQLNTLRPLSQSGKYYPIFATGALNSTGDVQYHDGREPQPMLVELDQNQNLFFRENSSALFNDVYPRS